MTDEDIGQDHEAGGGDDHQQDEGGHVLLAVQPRDAADLRVQKHAPNQDTAHDEGDTRVFTVLRHGFSPEQKSCILLLVWISDERAILA